MKADVPAAVYESVLQAIFQDWGRPVFATAFVTAFSILLACLQITCILYTTNLAISSSSLFADRPWLRANTSHISHQRSPLIERHQHVESAEMQYMSVRS